MISQGTNAASAIHASYWSHTMERTDGVCLISVLEGRRAVFGAQSPSTVDGESRLAVKPRWEPPNHSVTLIGQRIRGEGERGFEQREFRTTGPFDNTAERMDDHGTTISR